MLWRGSSPSAGTKRNRRIRGSGTWGKEVYNIHRAQGQELRKRRGSGTWGSESANLYRQEKRRRRQERRQKNPLFRLIG